jgi:DNA polymerase-3 subunit delta
MKGDLAPEYVLGQLEKGRLFPFYLFYGENRFLLEKVLNRIRETFIPEDVRDFNLHILYGDEVRNDPAGIIDAARSLPFMSQNRLIIVRRTENIPTSILERFISYLDKPVETTCLIFVALQPDFRKKFYKRIGEQRRAVNFKDLYDNQVIPWIKKIANEVGLDIEREACVYLQQIVGNRLTDLHSELEKLYVRYGDKAIGLEEVKEIATYSRNYTVFELMDRISLKQGRDSITILNRFLEEEGKDGVLRILGMLVRQMKLLRQSKIVIRGGGRAEDVARKLRVHPFLATTIAQQSRLWSADDLEHAFHSLYRADALIKSGSEGGLVLENVLISICRR